MNSRYDTFKVRKTLSNLDELLLEGEVLHQVFDSVQTAIEMSVYLALTSEENN